MGFADETGIAERAGHDPASLRPLLQQRFAAEIVNAPWVPSRNGAPGTTSLFATQLQAVYTAFLAQFPTITGGWNIPQTPIPVTVTGVTFYDRQHGQTGRAMNGVEIHPVLAIAFNTIARTALGSGASQRRLRGRDYGFGPRVPRSSTRTTATPHGAGPGKRGSARGTNRIRIRSGSK
jgi:hypothetical protein